MNIIDYRCKVGIAFFGGCGTNVLRGTIEKYNPDDYPDFLLFGANTDAKAQQLHFGDNEDPCKARWVEKGALILHQLGGKEVTGGRGAGAKPAVGRQAAESEKSMEAMRDFFGKVDELILLAGLGGGTGTGAMPVAARLAVEMGRPTMAIVIMPEPEEGRTKRATAALEEVQALVPTIPISNSYLEEYMKSLSKEERAKLTYKDAWGVVNDNSIVPLVRILREIIQETGDIINIDEADWQTMLSYGHHVFFGLVEIAEPEKIWEKQAEEIVDELFAARFQDAGAIERGKIIGLWGHGRWTRELFGEIEKQIRARVSAGRKQRGIESDEIEIIKGILHEVKDDKMWLALIIVSDLFKADMPIEEETRVEKTRAVFRSISSSERTMNEPASVETSLIRFKSDGHWINKVVPTELAARFNVVVNNIYVTRERLESVFEEVKAATGFMPDMPERFRRENLTA